MASVHSRIAVVIAALGLFAAACLIGDHGAARAAVGQSTGPLVASERPDAAVLVAQGLRPGEARSGEVTVTNVGDSAGAFALSGTDLTDTAARLSGVLSLVVQDVTPGRAVSQLYAGPPAGLSDVALGTLQQGEGRRYRFTVSVFAGAGNAYQGAETTMSLLWTTTAVGVSPAAAPTPTATAAAGPAKPAHLPNATLVASARQSGAKGSVAAWVACEARCTVAVGGTAVDQDTTLALRTVRRTLAGASRVRMRIALPARARAALAEHRAIAVRVRLKATMGTRVVVVRRTIRVAHR